MELVDQSDHDGYRRAGTTLSPTKHAVPRNGGQGHPHPAAPRLPLQDFDCGGASGVRSPGAYPKPLACAFTTCNSGAANSNPATEVSPQPWAAAVTLSQGPQPEGAFRPLGFADCLAANDAEGSLLLAEAGPVDTAAVAAGVGTRGPIAAAAGPGAPSHSGHSVYGVSPAGPSHRLSSGTGHSSSCCSEAGCSSASSDVGRYSSGGGGGGAGGDGDGSELIPHLQTVCSMVRQLRERHEQQHGERAHRAGAASPVPPASCRSASQPHPHCGAPAPWLGPRSCGGPPASGAAGRARCATPAAADGGHAVQRSASHPLGSSAALPAPQDTELQPRSSLRSAASEPAAGTGMTVRIAAAPAAAEAAEGLGLTPESAPAAASGGPHAGLHSGSLGALWAASPLNRQPLESPAVGAPVAAAAPTPAVECREAATQTDEDERVGAATSVSLGADGDVAAAAAAMEAGGGERAQTRPTDEGGSRGEGDAEDESEVQRLTRLLEAERARVEALTAQLEEAERNAAEYCEEVAALQSLLADDMLLAQAQTQAQAHSVALPPGAAHARAGAGAGAGASTGVSTSALAATPLPHAPAGPTCAALAAAAAASVASTPLPARHSAPTGPCGSSPDGCMATAGWGSWGGDAAPSVAQSLPPVRPCGLFTSAAGTPAGSASSPGVPGMYGELDASGGAAVGPRVGTCLAATSLALAAAPALPLPLPGLAACLGLGGAERDREWGAARRVGSAWRAQLESELRAALAAQAAEHEEAVALLELRHRREVRQLRAALSCAADTEEALRGRVASLQRDVADCDQLLRWVTRPGAGEGEAEAEDASPESGGAGRVRRKGGLRVGAVSSAAQRVVSHSRW